MRVGKVVGGVLAVMVGFLALTALFGSWYTVDEGERAVTVYNGRVTGVADPGLHLKTPIFEEAVTISVRQNIAPFNEVSAYSRDQQIATLALSVNYQPKVDEVTRIYTEYGSVENLVARVLAPIVNEEVKTIFGGYTALTAIQDRGKLNADIEAAIRSSLGDAPLVITAFQLENIDFSATFEQAVEQRATAEAMVATERQNLERERVVADRTVTAAQAQADSNLAAATAQAEATRLAGEAEASAIRAKGDALRENPGLVALIQAERWNGALPSTMLPDGSVPLLNLQGVAGPSQIPAQ